MTGHGPMDYCMQFAPSGMGRNIVVGMSPGSRVSICFLRTGVAPGGHIGYTLYSGSAPGVRSYYYY